MKYRMAKHIAEALLSNQPDTAYLHALEQMHTSTVPDLWRQILVELDKLDKLDKLKGENNASTKLQQPQQQIK